MRRTALDERLEDLRRAVEQDAGLNLELLADVLVAQLSSGEDDVAVLAERIAGFGYHEPSAEHAWARILRMFDRHLRD